MNFDEKENSINENEYETIVSFDMSKAKRNMNLSSSPKNNKISGWLILN